MYIIFAVNRLVCAIWTTFIFAFFYPVEIEQMYIHVHCTVCVPHTVHVYTAQQQCIIIYMTLYIVFAWTNLIDIYHCPSFSLLHTD